jgi:pimeloyl-ACP methyl ester carboxylesterase
MHALALLVAVLAVSVPVERGEYRRAAITDDGLRLGVYLYQPPAAEADPPTVVLLPDLGASHLAFDEPRHGLARLLRARGLRVLTLDWRGTGTSSNGTSADDLSVFLLHDLPAALRTLGGREPVVLVGWGYGGSIAYAAAAAGPLASRIAGVVGLNAVVDAEVPNALVERLLTRGRGGLDLAHDLSQPCADGLEDLFARLWTHGSAIDAAASTALRTRGLGGLTAGQVNGLLAWMKQGHTELGGDYPEMLSGIRVPVMAVLGPLDNWTHPEFASGIIDRLPKGHVRLVRVSRLEGFGGDAGHVGMVTGPLARELAPMIETFVREATAASAPVAEDAGVGR